MRKFTLLFVLIFIASLSFGQAKLKKDKDQVYGKDSYYTVPVKKSNLKADGDIFFTEEFDWEDPSDIKGWKMPDGWSQVDVTDLGLDWQWRAGTDSIKGNYTFEPGHIFSQSPDNGYLVLPMDEYNHADGVTSYGAVDNSLFLPPIDCSDRPSVVFKMNQYFRSCCGAFAMTLWVSNDDGVHWANWDLTYNTPTNEFCFQPYVEYNISSVSAGQSNVLIKIVWTGSDHYFWCIDDITLSEAYHYELQLEDRWAWFDNNDDEEVGGFFSLIPLSQIGTDNFGAYDFEAAFFNQGVEAPAGAHLNVEILKNGVSVYNEDSEARDMDVEKDTFNIETQYMADDYGDYQIIMSAVQNDVDQVPDNNV
ncbi:hypothetical protein ACFLSY_12045, partial [Bacteroidota bacterium]